MYQDDWYVIITRVDVNGKHEYALRNRDYMEVHAKRKNLSIVDSGNDKEALKKLWKL